VETKVTVGNDGSGQLHEELYAIKKDRETRLRSEKGVKTAYTALQEFNKERYAVPG